MASPPRWADQVAARLVRAVEDSPLPLYRLAAASGMATTTLDRRVKGIGTWTLTEVEAVALALRKHPDTFTNSPSDDDDSVTS